MLQSIITFFERYSFGVCAYLGEKFKISQTKIRLFFIYSSFLAVGFPLVFYFFAAIVLDIRSYIKRKRMQYWDI
ncbi:MAG: PspC domain-containing protein [Sphingobacteriales bacterium]|nr:PspC domain-containing protein [Sphingobacteriales bacterium]